MPDGTQFPSNAADWTSNSAKERLIVALDLPTVKEAERMVDRLHDVVEAFKIGPLLWVQEDADALMSRLIRADKKVFLDLKMYDIGNTIEGTVRNAAIRGISFMTVHHNRQTVEAAVRGRGDYGLKIFVVTVLTSLDNENLHDMGIERTTQQVIEWNTGRAMDFGCDGVIASPSDDLQKIRAIASAKQKGKILIATPGIRPSGSPIDDHLRFGTPSKAIRAGADYLIVGRPVYEAKDSARAAADIIAEMEAAAA